MQIADVMELFSLREKVALVTGGARNLGREMAASLAQAGATVAITSRVLEDALRSAEELEKFTGQRVLGLQLDVTSEDQVVATVRELVERLGRLDILINNAGNVASTSPETAPFEKRPRDLWQQVIDVNLTGSFLCAKHAVNLAMKPAASGNIVNIGSTAGIIGKDRRQYAGTAMGGATLDYHAAKGAVVNMTRDMAVYLAPFGIRVNCISPGGFLRGQDPAFVERYSMNVPMGRMGKDGKELMGAVVFLASEASSYVTGHNLVVDGGLTAW